MPKRKKIDRSHLVEATISNTQNFVLFEQASVEKQLKPGIYQGIDPKTGQMYLKVRCLARDAFEEIYEVDLSFMLSLPEFSQPFSEAFKSICEGECTKTIGNKAQCLSIFWQFLEQQNKIKKLSSISQELINEYIIYLNSYKSHANKDEYITDNTKYSYYRIVRFIIKELKNLKNYQGLIPKDLFVPKYQWPGRNRKVIPVSRIDQKLLIQIQQACLQEISQVTTKFELGQELIKNSWNNIPSNPCSSLEYKELGVLLASIERDFSGVLPKKYLLKEKNKHLYDCFPKYHEYEGIRQYLHATSRTLVPFIIMLAAATLYNLTTLLELKLSDVKESWFFGTARIELDPDERIILSGEKRRSKRLQIRTFSTRARDPFHPANLIEQVKRLTARLRPLLQPEFHDRLFVFIPTTSRDEAPTGFLYDLWEHNLSKFREDNRLPHFTLNQFRPTGSDIVHQITGGDTKAQQTVLNHQNPQITQKHYTTYAARQRNNEKLADVQNKRIRWVETGGKSDTRDVADGAGALRSTQYAATSGFECLDPYHSPIDSQKDGKLCTAYQCCPNCPNAAVNWRDAHALARLLQFEEQLTSEATSIASERYIYFYGPQLKALREIWLTKYTDATVWQQAKAMLPLLPPLPLLE